MLHAAGEVDGSWQIVEVWYSQEYAQRFDLDRLVPAIAAVTGRPPPGDAPDDRLRGAHRDHPLTRGRATPVAGRQSGARDVLVKLLRNRLDRSAPRC